VRAPVRIGCSGWEYKHWAGDFYPAGLPRPRWFAHYAARFDTVEINNSFYRLPPPQTVEQWRARTPPGFLYAWKASRYLTHLKRLIDPEEPVANVFDRAERLGPHLGPVLYQLPPRFCANLDRLARFLALLPPDRLHALEFRDPSWYAPDVLRLLDRPHLTLCLHDMTGSATERLGIGGFVYLRLHGATGRYDGGYADDQLADWAGWLDEHQCAGRPAFVYFNNDVGGHAPRDAVRLRDLLNVKEME
jgi:uncharacterized protein YecE (DUF72 family)